MLLAPTLDQLVAVCLIAPNLENVLQLLVRERIIGSLACTGAPSASNIKSAAANTHFVVGADRKRSSHQCGLLNRLTFTALPLRVLVCSA